MNVTMNQNADYGNWVPAKMLRAGCILSAAAFGNSRKHTVSFVKGKAMFLIVALADEILLTLF